MKIQQVADAVAEIMGISVADMQSHQRIRKLQMARELIILFIRQHKKENDYYQDTFASVGKFLGRHHTTIISAYKFSLIDNKYSKLFNFLYSNLVKKMNSEIYKTLSDLNNVIDVVAEQNKYKIAFYDYFSYPTTMRKTKSKNQYYFPLKTIEQKEFEIKVKKLMESINAA